jgi:hypothetical protein
MPTNPQFPEGKDYDERFGIDRSRCGRDRMGELICGGDRGASIECRETMDAAENELCSGTREFIEIWYSDESWANLQKIKI